MKSFCIDLDDTLVYTTIYKEVGKKHGLTISKKDITDWNLDPFPQYIKTEIYDMYLSTFWMCDVIKPIFKAQEFITNLYNSSIPIHIITARAPCIRFETAEKVQELFPEFMDRINSIYFVDQGASKVEILKKLNADIWVDDSPKGCMDSLENGIKTVMISNEYTKYNHSYINILEYTYPNLFSTVEKIEDIKL